MAVEEMTPRFPQSVEVSHVFGEGQLIQAVAIDFSNVVAVYIYQGVPRTGSHVLATEDGQSTLTLFAGRHEAEADALGRVLSRKLGRGISLSVYFERYFQLPVGGFEPLIDKLVDGFQKLKE